VTFIFRYRPLDLLQANGIAPGPAPKERTQNESAEIKKGENDDIEEIRILEERLSVLKGKRKLDSNPGTSKRLKLEEIRSLKHEDTWDEEVIDLT